MHIRKLTKQGVAPAQGIFDILAVLTSILNIVAVISQIAGKES